MPMVIYMHHTPFGSRGVRGSLKFEHKKRIKLKIEDGNMIKQFYIPLDLIKVFQGGILQTLSRYWNGKIKLLHITKTTDILLPWFLSI